MQDRKIITERTPNMTPNKKWDYIAHYEDAEPDDYEYGSTREEAIKNLKEREENE